MTVNVSVTLRQNQSAELSWAQLDSNFASVANAVNALGVQSDNNTAGLAQFEADLASSDPAKGAALVGFHPLLGDSYRTVSGKLSDVVSAEDFSSLAAAVGSGASFILLKPGKTYSISSDLVIPAGVHVGTISGRATINVATSATNGVVLSNPNSGICGVNIVGVDTATSFLSFAVTSPGSHNGLTVGSSTVRNVDIRDVDVTGFNGYGVVGVSTNGAANYGKAVVACNVNSYNNYCNFFLPATFEYTEWTNCHGWHGHIGVQNIGGNNKFFGGGFEANDINCQLGSGSNDNHGGFFGVSFNHAWNNSTTGFGLQANGVSNGHLFIGCFFWYSNISLTSCTGVRIANCQLSGMNVSLSGGNVNWIENNQLLGTVTRSFSGLNFTRWRNNNKVTQSSEDVTDSYPMTYVLALGTSSGTDATYQSATDYALTFGSATALHNGYADGIGIFNTTLGVTPEPGEFDFEWQVALSSSIAQWCTIKVRIFNDSGQTSLYLERALTVYLPAGASNQYATLRFKEYLPYAKYFRLTMSNTGASGVTFSNAAQRFTLSGR